MGKRTRFLRFWLSLAAMLTAPAAAWACTGQPMVLGVNPVAAAPGEQIRLGGEAVATSPLQIHWNSATGPVVSEVTPDSQGDFSVLLTIPEVRPGIYTLVLAGRADQGLGRTALEVLPREPGRAPSPIPVQAISSDLWNGFASSEGVGEQVAGDLGEQSWGSGVMLAGTSLLALGMVSLLAVSAVGRSRRSKRKAG